MGQVFTERPLLHLSMAGKKNLIDRKKAEEGSG